MRRTGRGSALPVPGAKVAENAGRDGIPEYGNNEKSCVERNRETDEAWAQELEPSGREPSGEDSGKKCSGKLYEVTERLWRPIFEEEKVEELYSEILMSAKAINIQQ